MVIGRVREIAQLQGYLKSNRPEFIAVYGRRRVGKTFLIRNAYGDKINFALTGTAHATISQQLGNFRAELQKRFGGTTTVEPVKDWFGAFRQLMAFIEGLTSLEKKVILLDELPWLDNRKSGFVPALEHFWNSWACARNDVLLVVCGSSASWMLTNLVNNRGGLHNRITGRIKLEPFTLEECKQYFQVKNSVFDEYQLLQLYMVLGGIPFYLDRVDPQSSATQNINNLCFGSNAFLRPEYANLYSSLFSKSERHMAIVEALAKKAIGLTRDALLTAAKLPNGGSTTRVLQELEESGFIRQYKGFGKQQRMGIYQLIDLFSLFHLRFITASDPDDEDYWINNVDNPSNRAWSGYAFEMVCLHHVPAIKQALGVSGVQTAVSSWHSRDAQIDLVIDRRDHIINLCEIKYSIQPFVIDKNYGEQLRNKIASFMAQTGTRKSVVLTFITTYGLFHNQHSGQVKKELTMDAIFGKQ